jgi:hypothetical protein
MALSPQQIAQARDWISTQWGGDGSLPGFGSPFNGGVYDPSNTQRNQAVLGAGQAMGYGADELSQILGHTAGDISAMQQQYAPQVSMQADIFRADNPGVGPAPTPAPTNPSPYAVAGGGNAGGNFGATSPYLMQIAEGMQTQANNNLMRNILPGIRGNAVATGGVGGSRQGLAEGQAIGDTQSGLSSAIGNLFNTDWQGAQNRALSQYGIDKNYDLGMTNAANTRYGIEGQQNLGNQGQWMNFYSQQRGLDQSGAATGAQIYNLANQGDWTGLKNASDIFNTTAGNNVTQTNGSQQGGGWQGILGGGISGATFGRNMGWW